MAEKSNQQNQPRPASPDRSTEKKAALPPAQSQLASAKVPQKAKEDDREITAYDIKAGDTLASIASRYGMALNEIKGLNPKVIPTKMEIGDRILILTHEQRSAPTNTDSYYIKSGDSFDKVAKNLGVDTRVIQDLNSRIDPRTLKVGQRILIPHVEHTAAERRPAAQSSAVATPKTIDTEAAFRVLAECQRKVESEGRTWVVSQKSRPNPEAVKAINDLLNAAGAQPPLGGTVFTARTFEALKSFQEANGLNNDGKFGKDMLDAFRFAVRPVKSDQDFISISTRLRNDGLDSVRAGKEILRWDSNFDGKNADKEAYLASPKDAEQIARIRSLQNLLNDAGAWPTVDTTGIFDANTRRAVMNFQKSQKNLTADGSVGEQTIKALDASRDKYLFALKRVLGEEGGVSNHKNDRGGLTFRGVTQTTYDSWRDRHHLAAQTVTQMSPLEARALYRELYWLKAYCDQCPKKIATIVFDCAVNCGVGTARTHLHQACDKANLSLSDLKGADPQKLKSFGLDLIAMRRAHHQEILKNDSTQADFKNGWKNRIDRLAALVGSITDSTTI